MSSCPCDRFAGVPSPIAKCQTCGYARKDHAPAALAPASAAAPAVTPRRISVSDPSSASVAASLSSVVPPSVPVRPHNASVSGGVAAAASVAPQVIATAASAAAAAGSFVDAGLAEVNSRAAEAEARILKAKKTVEDALASISALAAQPVPWKEYKDDDGRTYFYNTASSESVWEIPPEHAKLLADKKRLEAVKQEAQKEFESARSAFDRVAAEKSAAMKAAAEASRVAAE